MHSACRCDELISTLTGSVANGRDLILEQVNYRRFATGTPMMWIHVGGMLRLGEIAISVLAPTIEGVAVR